MHREEIKFVYVVVKRTGKGANEKERTVFDQASRMPIFYQKWEADKLCKRTPNSLVREIKFELFDWDVSNSGKTVTTNFKETQ